MSSMFNLITRAASAWSQQKAELLEEYAEYRRDYAALLREYAEYRKDCEEYRKDYAAFLRNYAEYRKDYAAFCREHPMLFRDLGIDSDIITDDTVPTATTPASAQQASVVRATPAPESTTQEQEISEQTEETNKICTIKEWIYEKATIASKYIAKKVKAVWNAIKSLLVRFAQVFGYRTPEISAISHTRKVPKGSLMSKTAFVE